METHGKYDLPESCTFECLSSGLLKVMKGTSGCKAGIADVGKACLDCVAKVTQSRGDVCLRTYGMIQTRKIGQQLNSYKGQK
jgi:hypothetical protein